MFPKAGRHNYFYFFGKAVNSKRCISAHKVPWLEVETCAHKPEQSTRLATCCDRYGSSNTLLASIVAVVQQVWLQKKLPACASACITSSLALVFQFSQF